MKTSIIVDLEDIKKVEAEEQLVFTMDVLNQMGLPDLEHCFPVDGNPENYTVDQKIGLRHLLQKFNVAIINDGDGGVKIYVENELVAEWKKIFVCLKQDYNEVDRRKRLFAQINIEYWTAFEKSEKS